jgi:hypothetical protein
VPDLPDLSRRAVLEQLAAELARANVIVDNEDPARPRLVWRKGELPPGA